MEKDKCEVEKIAKYLLKEQYSLEKLEILRYWLGIIFARLTTSKNSTSFKLRDTREEQIPHRLYPTKQNAKQIIEKHSVCVLAVEQLFAHGEQNSSNSICFLFINLAHSNAFQLRISINKLSGCSYINYNYMTEVPIMVLSIQFYQKCSSRQHNK